MPSFDEFFESLRGKSVALAGAGVSNLDLIHPLCAHGARVTVYDRLPLAELSPAARALIKKYGLALVSGPEHLEALGGDIVFRSPGLLPTDPHLRRAAAAGAKILSEISLFFELCPARTIGVTGSNGKSTTSTLIYELLSASGRRARLGGNIGVPLVSRLPEIAPDDLVVAELSSFQLMDMGFSPDVAVVTNLSPNHLDKHSGMEEYIDAKKNIFLHQKPSGILVANYDDPVTRGFLSEAPGRVLPFSSKGAAEEGLNLLGGHIVYTEEGGLKKSLLDSRDILLPGLHNVENYMAAIGAVLPFLSGEAVLSVAKGFGGVPHRLELVRTLGGVSFYNSSIDSSPSRTQAALSVFDDRGVVLIAGGSDKNIAFDGLAPSVCQKVSALVLTGQTSPKIEAAVRACPEYAPGRPEILRAPGMAEAVEMARAAARPGMAVLLSPACASFDAYKNFEHRGETFREAVNSLDIGPEI